MGSQEGARRATGGAPELRLMREARLLAPSRTPRKSENFHTGTIITARPNEVWASDHTLTVTVEEGQVTVFAAVDHCTTECVGLHAAKKATRFEALEPLRQAVRDYCGGFRAGAAAGIRNRHDHGSQYMSDDYQTEIAFLGLLACVQRASLKSVLLVWAWHRTRRIPFEPATGNGARPRNSRIDARYGQI